MIKVVEIHSVKIVLFLDILGGITPGEFKISHSPMINPSEIVIEEINFPVTASVGQGVLSQRVIVSQKPTINSMRSFWDDFLVTE